MPRLGPQTPSALPTFAQAGISSSLCTKASQSVSPACTSLLSFRLVASAAYPTSVLRHGHLQCHSIGPSMQPSTSLLSHNLKVFPPLPLSPPTFNLSTNLGHPNPNHSPKPPTCNPLVGFYPGSNCYQILPPGLSLTTLKTRSAGACENPAQNISLLCSELPMISHFRVKPKVLAVSPETLCNPLSLPYILASSPTSLPLICAVPSTPASLLFLKYANHRAFALAVPSAWKFLLPDNDVAHLTSFESLLKQHLLGEVYLGHSTCIYSPPPTSINFPPPPPTPALPFPCSPRNLGFYLFILYIIGFSLLNVCSTRAGIPRTYNSA